MVLFKSKKNYIILFFSMFFLKGSVAFCSDGIKGGSSRLSGIASYRDKNSERNSGNHNPKKSREQKARGVILKFHHWPKGKQKKMLLKTLKVKGLTKQKVYRSFKMWIVNWPGSLKPIEKALNVCKHLPQLSILKYCEPNILIRPAYTFHESHDFFPKILNGGKKNRSYLSILLAETTTTLEDEYEDSSSIQSPDIRTCGLVSSSQSLKEGRLSDYWAQELIGSDLLKEELKTTSAPKRKNFIPIFDAPSGDHDVKVTRLISGDGPQSVLPEIGRDRVPVFYTGFSEDFVSASDQLKKSGQLPSFINNSMGWANLLGEWNPQAIFEAFKSLSPPAVSVVSAGNDFFESHAEMAAESKIKASKNFDLVIVGSLSPEGFVSNFSEEYDEVNILAPSDTYITSADLKGEPISFGGTSGAAPLLTASLGGFEWLSGYHPSAEESKLLLEKTATPTVHIYEKPRRNGSGLLNTYKLGRVGKLLREKCRGKGSDCFKREIRNDRNYKFEPDETLKRDLARIFPACPVSGAKRRGRGGSCDEKEDVFNRLRRSVLLSPKRSDLWKVLGCIYGEAGFSENKKLLSRIALAARSKKKALEDLKSFIRQNENKKEGQRLLGVMARADINFLKKLARSHVLDRKVAAKTAGEIGGRTGMNILKGLMKDPDMLNVRTQVAMAIGKTGDPKAIDMLEEFYEFELNIKHPEGSHSYPSVKIAIADAAKNIGGPQSMALFEKMSENPHPSVRHHVAYLVDVESPEGMALLKKLSEDSNPEVRMAVVIALSGGESAESMNLFKKLSEDSNPEIRGWAAFAAGKRGDRKGMDQLEKIYEYEIKNPTENPIVKKQLAEACGNINHPRSRALLEKLNENSNLNEKETVIKSAGNIEHTELLEKLIESTPDYRKKVAQVLGNMESPESMTLLENLGEDPSPDVRLQVVQWAGKRGGRRGTALIKKLAGDENPSVRRMAAITAVKIRSIDDGLEILTLFESETNERVKKIVREAHQKIQKNKQKQSQGFLPIEWQF